MGISDPIIRVIIATLIAVLYFTEILNGTLGIILPVIAAVFVLISFISFCPIYRVFGIMTCSVTKK